jgi:hypothetical protein
MPKPRNDASPKPRRAKLNPSSRTKTAQKDRKKDKPLLHLKTVRTKVKKLMKSDKLLLPKLLDEAAIEAALGKLPSEESERRKRAYTIPITLTLFVQQVVSKDRGCAGVVTVFNKNRKAENLKPVSTNTSSYCDARMRIPLALIETLVKQTSQFSTESVSPKDRWCERRVLLVDGYVVSAPDTPENQAVYAQPNSQQPGLGFPQIRVCTATCLKTRSITDIQYGPVEGKKTGESTLFRQMFGDFQRGDVLVTDSNFENFRDLATLQAQGVDMVCDKNGTRTSPFKGTAKSVIEDIQVVLPRPSFNSSRFTRQQWEQLPQTLTVRVIRYRVAGRKKEITLVTTLLDRIAYPAKAIAKLYRLRWECELDIRTIKTVMGSTWLSCHTPEMLQRELMTYVLAYNVICVTVVEAAKISGYQPRDLSFKNAIESWLQLGQPEKPEQESRDHAWLLWSIAHAPLRKRPGRVEPRAIKRRSSKYPKMKKPRDQEKAALAP